VPGAGRPGAVSGRLDPESVGEDGHAGVGGMPHADQPSSGQGYGVLGLMGATSPSPRGRGTAPDHADVNRGGRIRTWAVARLAFAVSSLFFFHLFS
jgi:hypothetical protein